MHKINHIIFGIFCSFIFLFVLEIFGKKIIFGPESFILLGISAFYSILPDIDHKNSTITWFFIGVSVLGMCYGFYKIFVAFSTFSLGVAIFSFFILVLTFVCAYFFKHRGFIHSIGVGFVFCLPVWFLFESKIFFVVSFVSWYSHLMGDGFLWKWK
jgi:membrane-bound metal-dependent hydrolase YbcI (DUF457 family)